MNRFYFSTARDCGAPEPSGPNGALSVGSTILGSIATYTCDIGHNLIGESVATCETDGEWSSGAPVCQRKPEGSITT